MALLISGPRVSKEAWAQSGQHLIAFTCQMLYLTYLSLCNLQPFHRSFSVSWDDLLPSFHLQGVRLSNIRVGRRQRSKDSGDLRGKTFAVGDDLESIVSKNNLWRPQAQSLLFLFDVPTSRVLCTRAVRARQSLSISAVW